MTQNDFFDIVRTERPDILARRFLLAQEVAAFPTAADYASFQGRVAAVVMNADTVLLAGSGNWGYSLHPEKSFKQFDGSSDLDVAVISLPQFNRLWEEMRRLDRTRYHRLSHNEWVALRRNGENVYAGFISPLWMPDFRAPMKRYYRRIFNRLSDRSVGFRKIRIFFFKNLEEAVAYYERGFAKARRALR